MIINKRKFFVYLCCVLVWMGVIFSLSAEPSEESDETSLGLGRVIAEIVVPDFEEMSAHEQYQLVKSWNGVLRKLAHFSEYAVLGFFSLRTLLQVKISKKKAGIVGGIICVLYAASDELHQYFVPGRSCQIGDICIDSMGAITGIVFVLLVQYFWKKRANKIEI